MPPLLPVDLVELYLEVSQLRERARKLLPLRDPGLDRVAWQYMINGIDEFYKQIEIAIETHEQEGEIREMLEAHYEALLEE
jgi:hypothetical protein